MTTGDAPPPPDATGSFPLPADLIGTEPPPRRRRILPLLAAGVTVVAAIAATVIVLEGPAAHKAAARRTPAPTRASAPIPQRLLIGQLRAGDCLQGPPDVNTASWWPYVVTAVPCIEKHIAEVYFFSASYWPMNMAFPGHAKLVRQASAACRKRFQAYDGIPLSGSIFSFLDISPWDRGNWDSGDRLLLCTAHERAKWYPGGQPLYGSIKHSGL